MTDEQLDAIGSLIDKMDNLLAMADAPVPDHIHVEGLTDGVAGVRQEMYKMYIDNGGVDHWDSKEK